MLSPITERDFLRSNYHKVLSKINTTCEGCGRNPEDINLIWVSKTRSREEIMGAYSEGARLFGENKVQESIDKFPIERVTDYELHFIGRLQTNKIRKIVPLCSTIHSVDSLKLLYKLSAVCRDLNVTRKVFLQINTSEEESKAGFSVNNFFENLSKIEDINPLTISGLMTIGPNTTDLEQKTAAFRKLRNILERIKTEYTPKMPVLKNIQYLSMGMSNDFTVAIEQGSHYIRIGTDLFGPRKV